ncbi:Poly-beta-1,6-N-acetyl-D-glucosamine synthase [Delftia tsuruhatensis]|nr:Poly-beta-1,6-N-acetyl-D-glucosamine synthase [Delftia tsuruhatensis]CAC9689063.1 Poly-beta-1,6-N-acetyl-D-glucosamine synthase [Delftia tsuruhatensis]
MDEWEDFPDIGQQLLMEEEILIDKADLVTVTASILERKWAAKSRKCALVRNGVDFEFFSSNCVKNELLAHLKRPVIGFYGALAPWIDFALLNYLATRRPEWDFVLVGDCFVKDVEGIDRLPNVHLLGKKAYDHMPRYLHGFDVCLIPFKLNKVTHAVDPVKFYEYISVGKPVVSVPLEEMAIYEDYVYFAAEYGDFLSRIEAALREEDADLIHRRIQLAKANDWRHRYVSTEKALKSLYAKCSIVIVSYNNSDLTRQCIESIVTRTTYPHYEVIVVDNASQDDTCDMLLAMQRHIPNLKLILNDENRGFAAANNQGIAQAEGAYVVLLNNDTVVTNDWLEAMLRHLRDSRIGLVGPVTNSVGNEAKIAVDYTNLEQMHEFAARHTVANAGHHFDISVLAMFCVAMRREVFEEIGALDEGFGIGMFEDDDYCRRLQAAGYRTVCAEDSFVHHYGQASFKKLIDSGEYQVIWERNQAYFESKWGTWTPHSNSRSSERFS